MSRTENRCFYASAVAHGVLLLAVVVGSAFFKQTEKPPEEGLPPVLQMIAIDGRSRGGGNPNITGPSAPAPAPAPAPRAASPPKPVEAPAPPAPAPRPVPIERPVVKNAEIPLPVKETKTSKPDDTAHIDSKAKKNEKPEKRISIADTSHVIKRPSDKPKEKSAASEESDSEARQLAKARQDRASKVSQITSSFGKSLSSEVNVNVDSPGPGGQAFRDYIDIVVGIYQNAWIKPLDVLEENTIVQITVTIARNGRVINARVIGPSGVTAVDKSVRQTLERVRQFPELPEGTPDQERTLNIDFNLKARPKTG